MWAEINMVEERFDENPGVFGHTTVLRQETIQRLSPKAGGTYVDATLGAGGHTEAILQEAPDARVIAIDQDPAALEMAMTRLAAHHEQIELVHGSFGMLQELVKDRTVDGIVADLGISSNQLSDPVRGMSFRSEGPLDMRMDPTADETALDLIARLDQDELANIIYRFGEERRSRRVARCIKSALDDGRMMTTLDLRRAVVRAVGPARIGGVDPATRTFQALRIAVNGELEQLESLLAAAPRVLKPGGVLVVISFHSLEDRLVKRAFQDRTVWAPLTKKPITATAEELHANPRSRSAKLRAACLLDPREDLS